MIAESIEPTTHGPASDTAVGVRKTKKAARPKKSILKARKRANGGAVKKSNNAAKTQKVVKPNAHGTRQGSKTATILELLQRSRGATLAEIMEATSWQAHSVRGFLSGTLGKKMGLTVTSQKGKDGPRAYSIAK